MQITQTLPNDTAHPWPMPVARTIGYAEIVRRAYAGDDLTALTRSLVARVSGPEIDPGALMDLATVLQLQGGELAAEGRLMQKNALQIERSYQITHGNGLGPRILAFVTAGDFMANTPLDFLLHGSDAVLILHFVDAATRTLTDVPPHDVAFMAIGEAPETRAVLGAMKLALAQWHGRVMNRDVEMIASLGRDCVSVMLADEASIYAPETRRVTRSDLIQAAMCGDLALPMILRPIGSHAGVGLCLIEDRAALATWLRKSGSGDVYIAPYVEYRGTDGLYTKARVVLIDGVPYASHLAQSEHWMVHYLNADMADHPERRRAEAAWMEAFDDSFAQRHAAAFAALHRAFGLDYFGVDCAEMPDGRLLVFEVDVAMIVHDMDDAAVFPYKRPAMQKLFNGFLTAINAG
jgi:glutathione synthase/RimK-type ligase-like ATP-grasp enzyme